MPSTADRRLCLAAALVLPLLTGACAESVWAPDAEVQQALYRHDGPPALTLFTVINNRSGEGAHSGLMVNGSQRVVFDPAGSFNHPQLPERNDVVFGMTPRAHLFYIDYHARETYHVIEHTIRVTPEQAEAALRLVQTEGPVAPAACSSSIARVMRQIPGFESFRGGVFPKQTMRSFMALGATEQKHFDDSPDRRGDLIQVPKVR